MKKSIIKGIISGVALSAAIVTLVSCGSKEDKEYVVSFNSNDPDTTDQIRPTVYNDIVVKSGKTVDLADYQPTYAGWAFDGWYTDAEFTDEFTSESKVKADVKLYAKWIDTLDITFNSNGGTNVDPQSILPASTVTRPANPSKASVTNDNHTVTVYTFEGWYTNEALTNAFDFATEVTTDLTLYAKYDVSVEAAEGYNLVTSTINFADYAAAGTSALTPFTTADGVFSVSADGNKNQIRAKNRTWTKATYTPTITGEATDVTIGIDSYDTINGESSKTFTQSYVLGGRSNDSSHSLNINISADGYITIYATSSERIGIVNNADGTYAEVASIDTTDTSTTKVGQYVFTLKAGSYSIYRSGGTGEIYMAEYFSIVSNLQ